MLQASAPTKPHPERRPVSGRSATATSTSSTAPTTRRSSNWRRCANKSSRES